MKFNISQSQAIDGVRFSTATPLVAPQLPLPDSRITHSALHETPLNTVSFFTMMDAMAQPRITTQWGTAIASVHDRRYTAEIPAFERRVNNQPLLPFMPAEISSPGHYLDDQMQLSILPTENGDKLGLEVELDYRCSHFSVIQTAVIPDIPKTAGVSTISIHIGATLLIKAAVRDDKELKRAHPNVHNSIIKHGMCLANARMIASSMGGDSINKTDERVTTSRTSNIVAVDTLPAFNVDEHGLYPDEEAPLFKVTFIHPEDASAPRGSPKTRPYIHILENVPFTCEGLERPHAPIIQDLMVAAAYMRPGMFPYEPVFTPRNS